MHITPKTYLTSHPFSSSGSQVTGSRWNYRQGPQQLDSWQLFPRLVGRLRCEGFPSHWNPQLQNRKYPISPQGIYQAAKQQIFNQC